MEDWELEPARDLHLSGLARYRSAQRESGLVESGARLFWWTLLRATFRTWNRLQVIGGEHLPAQPSFVLAANHGSHIDAPLLTAVLPLRWRDLTFPIAARDVFFEVPWLAAFTAMFVNALPVFRGSGSHGLAEMRARLLREPCVMIVFPEGTRTRSGSMNRFRSGLGMLVAGTTIPVVPCHIAGAYEAIPANRWLLRPDRLTIRLAKPQTFSDCANHREGWDDCAQAVEVSVRSLASQSAAARVKTPAPAR